MLMTHSELMRQNSPQEIIATRNATEPLSCSAFAYKNLPFGSRLSTQMFETLTHFGAKLSWRFDELPTKDGRKHLRNSALLEPQH